MNKIEVQYPDTSSMYGYLSGKIFQEFSNKPFPNKPYFNADLQVFSFYFFGGLLRTYSAHLELTDHFFDLIQNSIQLKDEDKAHQAFYDEVANNNNTALQAIIADCWKDRPTNQWLTDWKEICKEAFDAKGYTPQTFLSLYEVINEQFSSPAGHAISRVQHLHRLVSQLRQLPC